MSMEHAQSAAAAINNRFIFPLGRGPVIEVHLVGRHLGHRPAHTRGHTGGEGEKARRRVRFAANAAPVRYLDYVLEDAQPAAVVNGGGVLVRVPSPARFAIHKLQSGPLGGDQQIGAK